MIPKTVEGKISRIQEKAMISNIADEKMSKKMPKGRKKKARRGERFHQEAGVLIRSKVPQFIRNFISLKLF